MEKRLGRPQLVSDEDIREAALSLLGEGTKPVVAKVRAKLIETKGSGGEPARITRVVGELTKRLAQAPRVNLDIPETLLKPAGDLIMQMFALANETAMESYEAYREEVEKQAEEAVGRAEVAADELRQAYALLEGRLMGASQKIADMESTQAGLAARVEQLGEELATARATLEAERQAHATQAKATNQRILELEELLKAKSAQPAIDMDELVKRLAQAAKEKIS